MDRSLFPGLPAFCLPHSPANSTILIHLLRFYTPSTTPDTPFHLYCFTWACCVSQLILTPSPSITLLLTSPWTFPLSFLLFFSVLWQKLVLCQTGVLSPDFSSCSNSPSGHPSVSSSFPAVLGESQYSNPRLAATCCNFSLYHVRAPHQISFPPRKQCTLD